MKNKVLNPTRQLNVYQFLTSNFNMKSSKFPLFNRNKTQTAVINMAIKRFVLLLIPKNHQKFTKQPETYKICGMSREILIA